MKKLFKKATAMVIAATMTATLGISANALEPVMSDNWSVAGVSVQGAPSGTGSNDSCYMVYSPKGIEVYCNKVSNMVNGGTGKVTITCTTSNVSMTSKSLTNTGESVTCYPSPTGAIKGINLNFSASASSGNIYNASGNAYTN